MLILFCFSSARGILFQFCTFFIGVGGCEAPHGKVSALVASRILPRAVLGAGLRRNLLAPSGGGDAVPAPEHEKTRKVRESAILMKMSEIH